MDTFDRFDTVKVEFVTLGSAAELLDVPPSTLRGWTDQMASINAHHVNRNNRKERIYYPQDLKIFAYIKELREEHGQKTRLVDIVALIREDARFELRSKEDAPKPYEEEKDQVMELLNQDDIKELMESSRVRQFVGVVIEETTKGLREELVKDVREVVKEEMKEENEEQLKRMEELQKKMDQTLKERDDRTAKHIQEIMESKKKTGFLSRLFGND